MNSNCFVCGRKAQLSWRKVLCEECAPGVYEKRKTDLRKRVLTALAIGYLSGATTILLIVVATYFWS